MCFSVSCCLCNNDDSVQFGLGKMIKFARFYDRFRHTEERSFERQNSAFNLNENKSSYSMHKRSFSRGFSHASGRYKFGDICYFNN